jgi:seryl-tRNA synthetase
MKLSYKERKAILAEIEGKYSEFDNESKYKVRKAILAEIEELYAKFDGVETKSTALSDMLRDALNTIKTSLESEDLTISMLNSLNDEVKLVDDAYESIKDELEVKEVIELIDDTIDTVQKDNSNKDLSDSLFSADKV